MVGVTNKCVSRLARHKSHHRALSNAAAPIPNTHAMLRHTGAGAAIHPGSNSAAPVTPRELKFTK